MEKNLKPLYEFGPFRLDPEERLLLRDGEGVPLTPKAFDLLLVLVEQPGRLLEKDVLMKAVWPDSFVEESNLADNVSRLRKALGEGEDGAKFIETVPRRGYRFVTVVRELGQENAAALEPKIEEPPMPETLAGRGKYQRQGKIRRLVVPLVSLAVLIALSAAAWSYFNRQPELNERDTILLTDFENKTGQEAFSGMLKQALAIQLQQSSFLTLFPDSRVQQTLQLMARPPDERVTAQIGREICQRQGIKALITGSIVPLGSHYVITLEAINAQNGETLTHHQTNAEGAEQVLQALTLAATQLRQQLGGLLRSIQKSNQLDQLRTSNLEALKDAIQARNLSVQGRYAEAILFGKRAVEIDASFSVALVSLAIWYNVTGQPESAAKYAEQAFLLRDKANEREKVDITIWYHLLFTGNQNKWLEALRLQKEAYPSHVFAHLNLALGYNSVGQYEQAVQEVREMLRLDPRAAGAAPPYRALSFALMRLNRFAEAKETIGKALELKLLETEYQLRLYELAFIEGDRVEMQRHVDAMSGRSEEYAALDWQTGAAAFAGQWRQAQKLSREAIDLAKRVEMNEVA